MRRPPRCSSSTRGGELGAHVGDDVAVARRARPCVGVAAPVHGDVARRRSRPTTRGHHRVGEPAGDVVDDRRAGLDRGDGGRRRSWCRRSPRCRGAASSRIDRQDAPLLLVGVDPLRRRAGSTRRRRRRCRRPRRRARRRARWRRRGRVQRPPSLNESGVTLSDAHDRACRRHGGSVHAVVPPPISADDLGPRGRVGERAAAGDRDGRAARLARAAGGDAAVHGVEHDEHAARGEARPRGRRRSPR